MRAPGLGMISCSMQKNKNHLLLGCIVAILGYAALRVSGFFIQEFHLQQTYQQLVPLLKTYIV